MRTTDSLLARLAVLLTADDRPAQESERLARLVALFAELPPPEDPLGTWPRFAELKARLIQMIGGNDGEALEEAFLALYAHVHGFEAPYTREERERVTQTGGYWSHAGGLSPILKAAPFLGPNAVSGDLGAGNGLQCLLLQKLYPHAKSIQIEISSRMVAAGKQLQQWLAIPTERVEWIVGDVIDASISNMSFVYLYRPLRPTGVGVAFYEHLAAELTAGRPDLVVFSVADCLKDFLPPTFEVFYYDGHLTCFRKRLQPSPRNQ